MKPSTHRESVRHDLVRMLPRLKRFADVLTGDKQEGKALLRRALFRMLDEHHRYQRGTLFDRWAFAEIYAQWLGELRDHAEPLLQGRASEENFAGLLHRGGEEAFDAPTVNFLAQLTPQQRSTLLLVYGEGFEHEDAARVLDTTSDAIEARLIRMSGTLADRLGAGGRAKREENGVIEHLYPVRPEHDHDRAQ